MVEAVRKDWNSSAGVDWLTGFLNRDECVSTLAATLVQSRCEVPGGVAVFWLNVDRFHQINDSFGYFVGDSVLAELGRRLERNVPVKGMLARMGGDEFAMILPCIDEREANRIARKLLTAMGKPLGVGTRRLRPSVSIGVALAGAEDNASELLERSDRAMRNAKHEGGGRIVLQTSQNQPAEGNRYLAREELSVEEMLHSALETGGLYLDYQPIVRVMDGTPLAVEALMRCRDGERTVPPGRFIPVAEKTGLIAHLGDWSLVTVAEFIGRMRQRGLMLKAAVNVSRAQLLTPAFASALHGVLAYTGIDAQQMELEITESLFMDAGGPVHKNIQAAQEAGFQLVLDDFGTGYSSLACLKDLPAGKIKLDRTFVNDLPHDKRSFGVARAVSQLAADLGIDVVAEGVETQEQYESLFRAGVTAVQGYYVAHPMSEQALFDWLQP